MAAQSPRRDSPVFGVLVVDAANNVIGGATAQSMNTVSGAASAGVRIESSGPSVSGNIVEGNSIGNSATIQQFGVDFQDAVGCAILGNTISGNASAGINLNLSSNVTVGGTTVAARNVISGNAGSGRLDSGAQFHRRLRAGQRHRHQRLRQRGAREPGLWREPRGRAGRLDRRVR